MFLIPGGHIGGQFLDKFGQIVYILVFYNIHFLDLFQWTVSNLFFCAVFIA